MWQRSARVAAMTILSNTGCGSVGVWLMTRRISAVAARWRRNSARSASRSSGAAGACRIGLRGFFAAVGALGVKDIDLGLADFAARSKAIRLVLEGKGPSYFGSDEIEWVEILSDKSLTLAAVLRPTTPG